MQRAGTTLGCSVQASGCCGFSSCGARTLGAWASVVAAHGLRSCTRSFSGCGRKPWVLSTSAGDLRELLRVPLRSQAYCGFGRGLSGLLWVWCNACSSFDLKTKSGWSGCSNWPGKHLPREPEVRVSLSYHSDTEKHQGSSQRTAEVTVSARGLSRVAAGNPGFPRLVSVTSGNFSAQKSPDTPGSPEGNTEGPGTASSEPLLPS